MTGMTKMTGRVREGVFVFLFAILVAIDQLAKFFADDIFQNQNFAFSLPLPAWLMYVIYVVVFCALIYYAAKNYRALNFRSKLALVLIFAGAASNIAERIFLGYVRDNIYISFNKWTGIYNAADGYIVAGIVILLFTGSLRNTKETKY